MASGHQRSERRGGVRTSYFQDRKKKIVEQNEEPVSKARLLDNVRVYINGYLSDTTDIEFKRIVCLAGGQIMWVYAPLVYFMRRSSADIISRHTASGATQYRYVPRNLLNASKNAQVFEHRNQEASSLHRQARNGSQRGIKTGKRQSEREITSR